MITCNECIHEAVCSKTSKGACLDGIGTCDNCKRAGKCAGITLVDQGMTMCHHGDGFFCCLWEENPNEN